MTDRNDISPVIQIPEDYLKIKERIIEKLHFVKNYKGLENYK